jgi:hypothetical protein
MTRKLKKMVLGAVLLSLLGLGALFGSAVSAPILGVGGWASVAHADGCDTFPPQPGLDCPPAPTPTPHK